MAKKGTERRYSRAHVEKKRRQRGHAIRRAVFTIAVIAVVVLAVLFLIMRSGTQISVGENAIGSIFSPIQSAFTSATQFVRDFFTDWRDYDTLKTDYDALYFESQQLRLQLTAAEEATLENARLKELLDAKDRYESLDPVYAKVIARDPGQWFDTFSINRGTSDGISVGMAVMTGDGLVGRVYEAGLNYAKVLSIIDSRSSVACLVERTRENGLMRGQITSTSTTSECYVYYLPSANNVVPGDVLVTSGMDSRYPKGLTVGVVTKVSRDAGSEGNYITVLPSADFQHIEEVLVLRTVIETDEEMLPVRPTATPKPVPTATPEPYDVASSASAVPEDDQIYRRPTPSANATVAPVIEILPEDSWVTG